MSPDPETGDPEIAAFRFGYGLPLPEGAPVDPAAMLLALRAPDRIKDVWPIASMAEILPVADAIRRFKTRAKVDTLAKPLYEAAEAEMQVMVDRARRATLARMIDNPDGFRERLTAFWADHFTTVAKQKVGPALPYAIVEDAIRPHLTANFAEMLTAATLHPAMLTYLDQTQSVGPNSPTGKRNGEGLNENLARELIELHTLGVGAGYSQDDVRQMAELLTGLGYNVRGGMFFDRKRAEPGPETVLGQVYEGDGLEPIRAVLRDLSRRPETAAHLARKLAVHFVSDNPDPGLVDALTAAWTRSGGHLETVYEALLRHPAAWVPEAAKLRQPIDFMVAALRALGIPGAQISTLSGKLMKRQLMRGLREMGQVMKEPRGPDGWPEPADAWITPQGLAGRITWAMQTPSLLLKTLPDPVTMARAALGNRASARLLWAVARAESLREGVGLVLASAEFNRR